MALELELVLVFQSAVALDSTVEPTPSVAQLVDWVVAVQLDLE